MYAKTLLEPYQEGSTASRPTASSATLADISRRASSHAAPKKAQCVAKVMIAAAGSSPTVRIASANSGLKMVKSSCVP